MKTDIQTVSADVKWHKGLTKDQVSAVVAYIESDFDKRKAYCEAKRIDYDSATPERRKSISRLASQFFSSKSMRRAVRDLLDEMLGGIKDTLAHRIIDTYQTRAFYNIGEILTDDGELRVPLSQMGRLACVVDGVEKKQSSLSYEVDEEGNKVPVVNMMVKYTLANRDKALEMLAKYMKLIQEDDGGTKTLGVIYISKKDSDEEWAASKARLVSGDPAMAVDAVAEEDDGGPGDNMDPATEAKAGP